MSYPMEGLLSGLSSMQDAYMPQGLISSQYIQPRAESQPLHASNSSSLPPAHESAPGPSSGPLSALPSTSGPIRKRRFSGAKIQPTRVKKVMQSDEEIGRMVASVPVAIGRAMEHFADKFLLAAAEAVQNSSARTLAPQHMKIAMLANPHFRFLERVLKEVGVPSRPGETYSSHASGSRNSSSSHNPSYNIQGSSGESSPHPMASPSMQMPSMGYRFDHEDGSCLAALQGLRPHPDTPVGQILIAQQQQQQKPYSSCEGSNASVHQQSQPSTRIIRRSSSNGSEGAPVEKKPRGRPRKIKKDKCVEEDMLVDESNAPNGFISHALQTDFKPPESNAKDRELMPPPALPFSRFPLPPSN